MEIQHKNTDSRGKFFIEDNNVEKAVMTYSVAGSNKIIIDHTEVDDRLQGEGLGHKLLDAAVGYARANSIKIVPLCPFVKSIFDKDKSEYQDVRF